MVTVVNLFVAMRGVQRSLIHCPRVEGVLGQVLDEVENLVQGLTFPSSVFLVAFGRV